MRHEPLLVRPPPPVVFPVISATNSAPSALSVFRTASSRPSSSPLPRPTRPRRWLVSFATLSSTPARRGWARSAPTSLSVTVSGRSASSLRSPATTPRRSSRSLFPRSSGPFRLSLARSDPLSSLNPAATPLSASARPTPSYSRPMTTCPTPTTTFSATRWAMRPEASGATWQCTCTLSRSSPLHCG